MKTKIANEFSRILQSWLTEDEMSLLRSDTARLLVGHPDHARICHSHDYCDANEAMCQAFKNVVERECWWPSDVDEGNCDEADVDNDFALWDKAWGIAKQAEFKVFGWEFEHPGWEFQPEFQKDVMPHLEDWSWHNDTKPCFVDGDTGLIVWADHLDPKQREFPEDSDTYSLSQAEAGPVGWDHTYTEPLLETEDVSEVKQMIDERRVATGCDPLFGKENVS
jgi:hypothetical protein